MVQPMHFNEDRAGPLHRRVQAHPFAALIGAGLALALLLPAAEAAPSGPGPAPEDSMGQRLQACTACHGPEGRAARDGYYPRIAGKPAGYLYHQLLNFRDGRRQYALMAGLLDPLTDDYLREIAEHFASLDLPYPAPQPATAPAEQLARGRTLTMQGDATRRVPACAACHGSALTGVVPATPGLLGLSRDYLNAQLGAWRNGNRRAHAPDCMAEIAQRLAPEDIAAVSHWLASQPTPRRAAPADRLPAPPPIACGGLPAAGQALPAGASR